MMRMYGPRRRTTRMVRTGDNDKEDGWAEATTTRMVRAGDDNKDDVQAHAADNEDSQGG